MLFLQMRKRLLWIEQNK